LAEEAVAYEINLQTKATIYPLPKNQRVFYLTEKMMTKNQNEKNIVNDAIVKDINQAILNLPYGTITIKVHNSKIIQIEVTNKKRFDDVWRLEEGGGI